MNKHIIGQRFAVQKPLDPTFGTGISLAHPDTTFRILALTEQDYDETLRLGLLIETNHRKRDRVIDLSIRFPLVELVQGRLFDLEFFYHGVGHDEAGTFGDTFRGALQSVLEHEGRLHFEYKMYSIGVVFTCGKSKFEYDFNNTDDVDDLFTISDDDD